MANYIRQYWQEIQNGLEVSNEVKNTYKHLINKLDGKVNDGFHFDETKANRIIDFAEKFIVPPKSKTKDKLKLLLWEKAFLQVVFGFVDNRGLRQYQEVALIIGRKNGKSFLSSLILLYCLVADKVNEPECYSCANSAQQARLVFECCTQIIKASKELQSLCKIRVNDILVNFNGGKLKPLACLTSNLDGLCNSAAAIDEIHEYKDNKLYDVIVDSQASRAAPLTIITSTAGFVREKFYDSKMNEYKRIIDGYKDNSYIDNRRIAFIYKLDSIKEMYDETKWIKANPSLDTVRDREKLKADVERCKHDEAKKKDVLTKFFNIPQTGQFHFLTVEECNNDTLISDDVLNKSRYFIGGFDLSKVNDITSAVALFKVENDDRFYVLNQNWLPADTLEEHIKKDKVPYDLFIKNGWLRLSGTNQIDYKDIVDWFEEVRINYNIFPYRLGYDAWSASYLVEDLKNLYGKDTLIPVRQGAKTLSLPLQHLKSQLQNKNIIYNNNQLMKTCLLNLKVVEDTNGNLNTIKNRNLNIRDDAACALLDALAVYYDNEQNYLNLI